MNQRGGCRERALVSQRQKVSFTSKICAAYSSANIFINKREGTKLTYSGLSEEYDYLFYNVKSEIV